jgi:hypothetical protein
MMMHTSKIDAPKGERHRSASIIRSKDLGFPPEGSGRSWKLHLNDAFKNIRDVAITGSGQRPKPRVFTRICHTNTPSNILYIEPTKPTTSRKEEATTSVSRQRGLRCRHPSPEHTPTLLGGKERRQKGGAPEDLSVA